MAHGWWVIVFIYEVEAQGLVVWHVQVVVICEVSVILPTVSERDFLVVLDTCPESVQDLCWDRVSMVGYVKQFLQGGAPISGRSVRQQTQVPLRLLLPFFRRFQVYHQHVLAASDF